MSVEFKTRIGVISLKLPLAILEVESFAEVNQSDCKELIDILNLNISTPFALISHRSIGASWDPTVLEHLALPKQLCAMAMVSESDKARRIHEELEQNLLRSAGIEHVATFSDMKSAEHWCLEKLTEQCTNPGKPGRMTESPGTRKR